MGRPWHVRGGHVLGLHVAVNDRLSPGLARGLGARAPVRALDAPGPRDRRPLPARAVGAATGHETVLVEHRGRDRLPGRELVARELARRDDAAPVARVLSL